MSIKGLKNAKKTQQVFSLAGLAICILASANGCKPKKAIAAEETAPPPVIIPEVAKKVVSCDTLFSFTKDIKPIMVTECVKCHNNFTRYEDVKHSSGRANFMGSMMHEEPFHPMPKNRAKLSDSTLRVIQCWIDQGSKL